MKKERLGSFELHFKNSTLIVSDICNSLTITPGDPEENLAMRGNVMQDEDGRIYLNPHVVLPMKIEIIFHKEG